MGASYLCRCKKCVLNLSVSLPSIQRIRYRWHGRSARAIGQGGPPPPDTPHSTIKLCRSAFQPALAIDRAGT